MVKGQRLLTANLENVIRVWNLAKNSLRWDLGDCFHAENIALSCNGPRQARILSDTTVEIENIPRQAEFSTIKTNLPSIFLTFSPGGRFLAICSEGRVDVHALDPPSRIATYPAEYGGVQAAAISPDSSLLAAVMDCTQVWSMDSQRLCGKLQLHGVAAVSFSSDGQLLVGHKSSCLELWHWASATYVRELRLGEVYLPPQLPSCWRESIDFSSDGRLLVSGCGSLAAGSEDDGDSAPDATALAHFYILGEWVTYASYEVLWLPPGCRYPQSRMHDNVFAWSEANGDVDCIELDSTKISQAGPPATVKHDCYVWKKPKVVRAKWKKFLETLI